MFSASARPAARDETACEEQSVAFRMKWDELRSSKLIAVCLAEKQAKPNMFKNHTTMEKVSMTRVNKAVWLEEMGLKAIPEGADDKIMSKVGTPRHRITGNFMETLISLCVHTA